MGILNIFKRRDPEVERLCKKSDEDVLLVPGRSVYHLSHACFSGSGLDECIRIPRKEAERQGYRLCKNCQKTYLQSYDGDPGLTCS